MANRYYIGPRTQNPVVTGANMFLKFSEMKNRQGQLDVARERTKLLGRQTDAEFGTVPVASHPGPIGIKGISGPKEGLASRRVGAAERLNDLRQQQQERNERLDPISEKNFGMDKVTMLEGPLKAAGLDKAYAPVLDSMKAMAANPKFTNREVFLHYKSNWPQYQQAMIESLNKEATKPGITPAQRDQMIEQMTEIEQDQTGAILDQLMPGTALTISNEQTALGAKSSKWSTPQKGLDADGNPIVYRVNNLNGEVDILEGVQPKPGSNMEVFDRDGNLIMRTGGGTGSGEVSKSVQSKLQTGIIEANDSIDRLGAALESYQPEFNTFPFRAGVKWEEFKQILGMEKDPAAHQKMVAFNGWYKSAMRDYGIAIQQLGKGNLTKNEEQIYGAGLPNPGSDLIPKDPPEVYFEAVKQRVGGLRAIAARYNYYLNSGFVESDAEYQELVKNDRVYSTKEMYNLIDQKGAELEKFYNKSGLEKTAVDAKVTEELTNLFGVRF